LIFAASLPAADFTFGTMLRAGLSTGADWELTAGANSGDTSQTKVEASPYYANDAWQAFEIGYDGNAGFIRFYNAGTPSGSFISASFARTAALAATATWTLNTFLSASGNGWGTLKPDSDVRLNNLGLSNGLTVVTAPQNGSHVAQQGGLDPNMTTNLAPIVFRSNNPGGQWMLSGRIRFDGLALYTFGLGAQGSQLQFGLTASAVEPGTAVPEPATWVMCAGALAFGCYRRGRFRA
jgi:hypothetical protein